MAFDWDEILVTKDPDNKEVSVNFKAVDGTPYPGSPASELCVRIYSNETFVHITGSAHWVWLELSGVPDRYVKVRLDFDSGNGIEPPSSPQYAEFYPGDDRTLQFALSAGVADDLLNSSNYRAVATIEGTSCGVSIATVEFQKDAVPPDPEPEPIPDEDTGGDPLPGDNPECAPHACTAWTDWMTTNGTSNVLPTYVYGDGGNLDTYTGAWDVAEAGSRQGSTYGWFGKGVPLADFPQYYYENTITPAQNRYFWFLRNGLGQAYTDNVYGNSDTFNQTDGLYGGVQSVNVYNNNSGWFCTNQKFGAPAFLGQVRGDSGKFGTGRDLAIYTDNGGGGCYAPLGIAPQTLPIEQQFMGGGPIVNAYTASQYLSFTPVNTGLPTEIGVVPDSGKYWFTPVNCGNYTYWIMRDGNIVNPQGRAAVENSFVRGILDFDNNTFTLESYTGVALVGSKTISVDPASMCNTWITVTSSHAVITSSAFAPEARHNVNVKIGNNAALFIQAGSIGNQAPDTDLDPPEYCSKFWHPQGTGDGDNNSPHYFASSLQPALAQQVTYQGNALTALCIAVGDTASEGEKAAFDRQFKTYVQPDYCNRIP